MPHNVTVVSVDGLPDELSVPFVEPVPSNLRCSLCYRITEHALSDPRDHIFCSPCTQVLSDVENMFTCTVCAWQGRQELLTQRRNVADAVRALVVLCPKQCSFQGSLLTLKEHFRGCGSTQGDEVVSCPLCKEQVTKRGLGLHVGKFCNMRIEPCPYCICSIGHADMEHHMSSCDYRPSSCQYCMLPLDTFKELREKHLPQCELRPRLCDYNTFGCVYEGTSEELRKHEAETNHIELVNERFQQMNRTFKESKEQCSASIEQLRTTVDGLFAKNLDLENSVQELRKQQDQKSHETAEMCARYEEKFRELQDGVKKNEVSVGEWQESLRTAMTDMTLVGPEFKHIWKIQPYSHLRRVTRSAENKYLKSEAVRTGSPGYLFTFSCRFTESELSVCMNVHSGEDDDLLPWPLPGRIIVTLKSQTNPKNDVDKVIDTTNPSIAECFVRPEAGGINPRFGFVDFVKLPVLENERKGFLVNDCFILQFTILLAKNSPPNE